MTVKRLPNILTLLRMPGAAALIGLEANQAAFWLVYTLCGLSDIMDGGTRGSIGCAGWFCGSVCL